MEQANTVAGHDPTLAVAHFDFFPVLIQEPVWQPRSAGLGQDKWPRFDNAGQSPGLASLQPAFEITFRAGGAVKIKNAFHGFVPGPGDIAADGSQTGFLGGVEMLVPKLAFDPEIVNLSCIEKYFFAV